MKKNILIVKGSPRTDGNSRILAEAFKEGACRNNHIIEEFDIMEYPVKGCNACNRCWRYGSACVYGDGFNHFASLLDEADVVIFATPVYWGTFPAQLKALIDKLYSYTVPWCEKNLKPKKTGLLACGDGDDAIAFAMIESLIQALAEYMKWEYVGSVTVGGLVEAGEVKATDGIDRAIKLGMNI